MSTNNYIAKLKSRLDQAIIQRDHWKQVAANLNYLTVSVIDPVSRSTYEYRVDPDSVRAMWARLDELRTANQRLEGEVARLREALSTAKYRIEQGRVWNGMGWSLTGLHPHGQQKALDAIDAALAGAGGEV